MIRILLTTTHVQRDSTLTQEKKKNAIKNIEPDGKGEILDREGCSIEPGSTEILDQDECGRNLIGKRHKCES